MRELQSGFEQNMRIFTLTRENLILSAALEAGLTKEQLGGMQLERDGNVLTFCAANKKVEGEPPAPPVNP